MNKQLIQSVLAIALLTGMHFASGLNDGLQKGAMLESLMLSDLNPWRAPVLCPKRPEPVAIDGEPVRQQALAQLTADLQGTVRHSTLPPLPALRIGALSGATALAAHDGDVTRPKRPLLDLNFLHFSLNR